MKPLNLHTIESKLVALENLLSRYTLLWQQEILNLHLHRKIPSSWLAHEFLLTTEQLLEFAQSTILPLSHPWHQLSQDLKHQCEIPILYESNFHFFQPQNSTEIKSKKQHEINQLLHFTNVNQCLTTDAHIVDLAGGKGHFSKSLIKFYTHLNLHRSVVDYNIDFYSQNLTQFADHRNHFYCLDLLKLRSLPLENPTHLFQLHGCGHLSDQAITFYQQGRAKNILLIGCCYHQIRENISFITNSNIQLTPEALYLATRTHKTMTLSSWNKRLNQKHYRYTFEIWFQKKFQRPMSPLKSSSGSLYEGPFEQYACEQLKRLQIPYRKSYLRELDYIYLKEENLREQLIKLGIIRTLFSRPIEIYIHLRRAKKILMVEQKRILMGEIFDKKVSPRNIILYAEKTS